MNLESWITPASCLLTELTGVADTASAACGFSAAVITAGALAQPVLAPAAAVMGIAGLTSCVYTSVRSGFSLAKRQELEQSISITNRSNLNSWLGVAGGIVSLGSLASTKALAAAAMAGKEVSLLQEVAVNGMNISSMLLSGTGLTSGIIDLLIKWKNEEEVGLLDIIQLSASLFIFTHSVYNFRLASTITTEARNSRINAYREDLSSRQRRMFDKMTKETVRTRGANRGKVDVIRLINEVPDKQYLNDLYKVNKQLNKNNVRFTAGENGNVRLNEQISVKPGTLRASVQHGSEGNVLGSVQNSIPQSHQTIPNKQTVNLLTQYASTNNSAHLIHYVSVTYSIAEAVILNSDNFQSLVRYLIEEVGNEIATFLIESANDFIQKCGRRIEEAIKTKLFMENVLWNLYTMCKKHIQMTLDDLKAEIFQMFVELTMYYTQMATTNTMIESVKCKVCKGRYQICPI